MKKDVEVAGEAYVDYIFGRTLLIITREFSIGKNTGLVYGWWGSGLFQTLIWPRRSLVMIASSLKVILAKGS